MGLIIKNGPIFTGSLKTVVPTPTYSGEGDPSSPEAVNPYTGDGPLVITTTVFNHTGVLQNIVLPGNAQSVSVVMWGASGGSNDFAGNGISGPGGFSSGTFIVSGGETLDIIVGGAGSTTGANPPGGFGGGGNGGNGGFGSRSGGGGGGRSSVAFNGQTEIITAGGGGGGSGYADHGGFGGGLAGGDADPADAFFGSGGGQDAFTTGAGSAGQNNTSNVGGGGGGGGWNGGLGGLGGNSGATNSGGGGGSGHADGVIASFVTETGAFGVVTAPQNTHEDYVAGIGQGVVGNLAGNNGMVVLKVAT